ncbi:hypothetical protein [Alkalimarinus coralli]|uniref:hypothetical protein n=1 Tax=Alkalimarinus coralli TaxID=2935863 RepID=UPI00202B5B82|nr:hypothetical protein [Alkalimarinus coralli]
MLTVAVLVVVAALLFFLVEYLNGSKRSLGEFSKFDISFNGENIQGLGLFIDTRSDEQKARNRRNGRLDGDVIIFLHGHGQQPKYGIEMTTQLAEKSRSGIVFIPHVYTPYGCVRKWRGDKGKLVLLMALCRYCLAKKGLQIPESDNPCELPISINERGTGSNEATPAQKIDCKLTVVGWSHGGLLARRFANANPSCVNNLAQMTPAGYESWGRRPWAGVNLFTNFMIEVGLISLMVFKGQFKYPLIAGVAIVRGTLSDSLYAFVSYVKSKSNLPLKLARAYIDIEQCSHVATDVNVPVSGLDNIVVLFGQNDSVFEARNALSGVDLKSGQEFSNRLFEKFYPSAVKNGSNCSFKVLPGNHIGPLVHAEQYIEEVLKGTGQRA